MIVFQKMAADEIKSVQELYAELSRAQSCIQTIIGIIYVKSMSDVWLFPVLLSSAKIMEMIGVINVP